MREAAPSRPAARWCFPGPRSPGFDGPVPHGPACKPEPVSLLRRFGPRSRESLAGDFIGQCLRVEAVAGGPSFRFGPPDLTPDVIKKLAGPFADGVPNRRVEGCFAFFRRCLFPCGKTAALNQLLAACGPLPFGFASQGRFESAHLPFQRFDRLIQGRDRLGCRFLAPQHFRWQAQRQADRKLTGPWMPCQADLQEHRAGREGLQVSLQLDQLRAEPLLQLLTRVKFFRDQSPGQVHNASPSTAAFPVIHFADRCRGARLI